MTRSRRGGIAAEQAAVGVGGGAAPEPEVMAQRGRVAETRVVRDGLHRLVGLFQQLLGEQDTLTGQPPLGVVPVSATKRAKVRSRGVDQAEDIGHGEQRGRPRPAVPSQLDPGHRGDRDARATAETSNPEQEPHNPDIARLCLRP